MCMEEGGRQVNAAPLYGVLSDYGMMLGHFLKFCVHDIIVVPCRG